MKRFIVGLALATLPFALKAQLLLQEVVVMTKEDIENEIRLELLLPCLKQSGFADEVADELVYSDISVVTDILQVLTPLVRYYPRHIRAKEYESILAGESCQLYFE